MLQRHGGFVFDDSQFPKPGNADFVPTTEDEFWEHGVLLQQRRKQQQVKRPAQHSKTEKFSDTCRRLERGSGKLDKNLDRSPEYY